MSVDDRLRAGLELNARAVVPEGEVRLSAVRARHQRRLAALSVAGLGAVAASVLVVAGVTGDADRTAPAPVPPAGSSTRAPVPVEGGIPDSTWRRVVTGSQARAEGVSRQRIRDDIGADDRLPLELRFDGGTFTQTGDFGGSVWEIGDSGTTTYDDRDRVVIDSDRCDGCSPFAVTWRIEGSQLVVTALDPRPGPMARTVWLGTWRRTS